MRKYGFALLFVLPLACGPQPTASSKPSPPIDLQVETVGKTTPGSVFELVVRATPHGDGPVDIRISLPEGVTLNAGECQWSGPLRAGRTREQRLSLSVPDTVRREILVSVGCRIDARTKLSACESLILHDAPAPEPGVLRANAAGEAILDFPYP